MRTPILSSPLRISVVLCGILVFAAPSTPLAAEPVENPTVLVTPSPLPDRLEAHVIFPQGDRVTPLAFHYLEHLTWLSAVGNGKLNAGRHSNAWTKRIALGYWLSGGTGELADILRRLSGVFKPFDLPRPFAEDERKILLREYEQRLIDNPGAQAELAMDAFLYAGNRDALSPLGTPAEIRSLSYDAARALHDSSHRPDQARLVIIGDVTRAEIRQAMLKTGWPKVQKKHSPPTQPPFKLAEPDRTTLRFPDPHAVTHLIWRRVVTLPRPVQFDLLEAETALLRDILDTNLPGGLAGPLRFDASITRSFDIQIWPIDEDNIEISFTAWPDSGVTLAALRAAFEKTFARIARDGIPKATYARVLKRFDDYWPDWKEADKTARWMANYTLRRAAALRQPLDPDKIRRLPDRLSRAALDSLLHQLAGRGRTAVAFIGSEDRFK